MVVDADEQVLAEARHHPQAILGVAAFAVGGAVFLAIGDGQLRGPALAQDHVFDTGIERIAHGLAATVDQLALAVQRHYRQPGLDEVADAVIARRHRHPAPSVDIAPLALPAHRGQAMVEAADALELRRDHQLAVAIDEAPGMPAQRLVGRHAVDFLERGRQQHGGAVVRQRPDAASGALVGLDVAAGRGRIHQAVDAGDAVLAVLGVGGQRQA